MTALNLEETLRKFDGRSVAPFQAVAAYARSSTVSVTDLCKLARRKDEALQIGATWVIKDLLESDDLSTSGLATKLIPLMDRVVAPDAKLHLVQCLPLLEIPSSQEERLAKSLKGFLKDEYKFLRAWSYNGLGLLAVQNPKYRASVKKLFAKALETEAASVKARVRHAQKALEKAS